jgi:hypothetical protein
MKTQPEKSLGKAYHRPEVKDYGNISKLTAGAGANTRDAAPARGKT